MAPAKRKERENQRQAKKRRREEVGADRISELPVPILQNHILSLLPQRDAVRTCILSKSWRYLGPTRPKIEFEESSFTGERQTFLSVVDKQKFLSAINTTLQRYHDQKLSIQELVLDMLGTGSESISLLKKWIPIVVMNMGVKTLRLLVKFNFSLPLVVFQAEFLEELFLQGCKLNKIFKTTTGELQVLRRLRTLSLGCLWIDEEALEKIMSSCPVIEYLVLDECDGLRDIKVNKAQNLKHFDFFGFGGHDIVDSIEIDDAPSLETIRIHSCQNWYRPHKQNQHRPHKNYLVFPPLIKSLCLWKVHLPNDELFFNLSSNNCPCLEELELRYCSGITELKLSNHSLKRLVIFAPHCPIKVAYIDAANMIYFEFKLSGFLPSIYFTKNSRVWKSRIEVWPSNATWSFKLYEFLRAFSQSQISLEISYPVKYQDTSYGDSCEPVVVEHLHLSALYYSSSEVLAVLNSLFHICRPRYIGLPISANSQKRYESQLAESVWKTLIKTRQQRNSEKSSIQVSDKNKKECRPVKVCEMSNNLYIWFRLNWGDLS